MNPLCNLGCHLDDLPHSHRVLKEVRPILHHFGSGLQIESVIVGCANLVARHVGKLQFDVLVVVALFMEDR